MTALVTTDVVDGTSIDSSDVNNNMAAIRSVVNGNLDDSNLAAAAAIAISKLANFPSDATRFLRGDGNWAVPPSTGGGGPVPPSTIVGYPSDPAKFLRGDGAWAAVSVIPSSIGGFPANGAYALRGDGSWGTAYTTPAFIAGYPSDGAKVLRGDGSWGYTPYVNPNVIQGFPSNSGVFLRGDGAWAAPPAPAAPTAALQHTLLIVNPVGAPGGFPPLSWAATGLDDGGLFNAGIPTRVTLQTGRYMVDVYANFSGATGDGHSAMKLSHYNSAGSLLATLAEQECNINEDMSMAGFAWANAGDFLQVELDSGATGMGHTVNARLHVAKA